MRCPRTVRKVEKMLSRRVSGSKTSACTNWPRSERLASSAPSKASFLSVDRSKKLINLASSKACNLSDGKWSCKGDAPIGCGTSNSSKVGTSAGEESAMETFSRVVPRRTNKDAGTCILPCICAASGRKDSRTRQERHPDIAGVGWRGTPRGVQSGRGCRLMS